MLLDDLLQKNVILDVILMCESYLNNHNVNLAEISGYKSYYKNRENRPGGGIIIFVCNKIMVTEVLTTPFNDTTESLFLKLKVGNKIICIGEIYRIPNTSLKLFADDYCEIPGLWNMKRMY